MIRWHAPAIDESHELSTQEHGTEHSVSFTAVRTRLDASPGKGPLDHPHVDKDPPSGELAWYLVRPG